MLSQFQVKWCIIMGGYQVLSHYFIFICPFLANDQFSCTIWAESMKFNGAKVFASICHALLFFLNIAAPSLHLLPSLLDHHCSLGLFHPSLCPQWQRIFAYIMCVFFRKTLQIFIYWFIFTICYCFLLLKVKSNAKVLYSSHIQFTFTYER